MHTHRKIMQDCLSQRRQVPKVKLGGCPTSSGTDSVSLYPWTPINAMTFLNILP